MRKAMKQAVAFVLCAVMILGTMGLTRIQAAGGTKTDSTSQISVDTGKYVYANSDTVTYVPAGYTYVYTDADGQIYTRQAAENTYVSARTLTSSEAEALSALSGGESGYMTAENGNVLKCVEFDAAEAAAYSQAVQEILGDASTDKGEKISLLAEPYAPSDPVKVMITFETSPVIAMESMSVSIGEKLGEKELSAMKAMVKEQTASVRSISRTLGYDIQVTDHFTLLTNAVSATVQYQDLATINNMPGVKKAYLMPMYSVPDINAATVSDAADIAPNLKYAGPTMGANDAWELGYAGEGMTVAVIDTGLCFENPSFAIEPADPEAVAFQKADIEAILKENVLHAEELTEGLEASDVYYSSKIPYGYNYADGEANFGSDDDTMFGHGSHVAGIVAGNLPEDAKEEFDMDQMGIAPEAQLIIMKVFDMNGNCYFDYLIAAIEDAIILGVDCANLSLGSSCGPMYYEGVTEVYDAAYEAGINVVVSAGNDAFTGYGSFWGDNMVESGSVSTGTLGMPGTFDSVLTVASAENSFVISFAPGISWPMEGGYRGLIGYAECEDVPEGKGFQEALAGSELEITESFSDSKDKLVLVPFEGGSADQIAAQAAASGAAGVLLYDPAPEEGEEYTYIAFTLSQYDVPMASTCAEEIAFMKQSVSGKVRVDDSWNPSEVAGEMSSFSSWGPTDGLTLKPEITGIGGNVFSAYYGEYFAIASGTSMSSPAVAATAALVRQYLKELGYPEADIPHAVNCLLMSTATPILDEEHGTYYAVRRQGAGMANAANAIAANAFIRVDGTNKAKFELGDDPKRTGQYELKFEVVNFGDTDQSYTLDATVLGQIAQGGQIKNGQVTYLVYDYMKELTAKVTTDAADGKITVPAKGAVEVSLQIALSEADKNYMEERFPYGSYVEGFVQLHNDTGVSLSAPFLAFYGDFGEGPILEEGTYETLLGGEHSYYTADQFHNSIWSFVPLYDQEGLEFVTEKVYLGDTSAHGFNKIPANASGGMKDLPFFSINAGISPNGDFNRDAFEMGLGLKRNAKGIHYTVTNVDTGEVIFEQTTEEPVGKTYFSDTYGQAMYGGIYSTDMLSYEWLYPLVETEWNSYYDTSSCLLEENTLVQIRAEVIPEYESATLNANDSVEFTLYIDVTAPFSSASCFNICTESETFDFGDGEQTVNMYKINAKPDEYWFVDYTVEGILTYEEGDGWGGMVFTSVYASNQPAHGDVGEGAFGTSDFNVNSKYFTMAYDYAGNSFAMEVYGGKCLLDYVDLTPDSAIIQVGETVTIQNTADTDLGTTLDWSSSDDSVAEIVESDNGSCIVKGLSAGLVTIHGGFGDYTDEVQLLVVDPTLTDSFKDIAGHWAEEEIVQAINAGLFQGVEANVFSPNTNMTRAQLVTVLYRLDGAPEVEGTNPFQDVIAGKWYTDAVIWASENGIVNGKTAEIFDPNAPLTREQFAAILYRYAVWKGRDVSTTSDLAAFTDANKTHDYAKEAMAWAVGSGLIKGTTANTLSPTGTATRAQGATILMRFLFQ